MKRQSFEQRAAAILDRFDAGRDRKLMFPRPFLVELFGTPKAGKSTIKEMLKHFFKRNGWSVSAPTEGAEMVEWVKRVEPDYNFQTAEYALSFARECVYGPRHGSFHVVIFDRAIYDAAMRMEYYYLHGKMSEEQRNIAEGYYLLPWNKRMFDLHVCLATAPEVSIERELARAITREHGETMNPATLADLLAAHESMWRRLGCAGDPAMFWHETALETPGETARVVLDAILTAFDRRS